MDCDTSGRDHGCHGGYMQNAFQFIVRNRGIAAELSYPYVGTDVNRACNTKNAAVRAAKIVGFGQVPANERALLAAVANQPVSVAVDSNAPAFRFYAGGIITGDCGVALTHAVTVVGYGTACDGTKYWMVKNSYGSDWGEGGYLRIQRDSGTRYGLCGIAMDASYPIA